MAAILCPTNGLREQQLQRGIKPKNHMAEQRQRIKEQEEVNRKKKEEEKNIKCKYRSAFPTFS